MTKPKREQMKLKTLKDLKSKLMMYGNEEAIVYELKQEAIKHLKFQYEKDYHTAPDTAVDFIKHFFNITEKDLK